MPFQDNPRTGDCRIAGTTASLAGLEAGDAGAVDRIVLAHAIVLSTGGMPLLYLGDEVGQLNDYGALDEPGHGEDSRWVNRPRYPAAALRRSATTRPPTPAGSTRACATSIEVRRRTPELAGNALITFDTHNPHLVAYQRPGPGTLVLVIANVADDPQHVDADDALGPARHRPRTCWPATSSTCAAGLTVPAHGVRVAPGRTRGRRLR